MGGEGRAHPLLLRLRQHLDAWPRLLGQRGRRSAVYGRDRRTVMELCFTGISSKKGIPAAKPSGYPFCVAKSLFATQRHFSELQEVLKNGDHHRAGHPSAPLAKGSHFGADSGYPDGKSRRDTLFFIVSPVRSAGGAIFAQNMTTKCNLRYKYCVLYSVFRRRTPRL